jgi:hypothetical protein
VTKTSAVIQVVGPDPRTPSHVAFFTGSRRALLLPLLFIAGFVAMTALPPVRANSRLAWSFWAAAICLGAWYAWLVANVVGRGRTLSVRTDIRKQHYLQACAQGSVLLYWGFYWREVYDSAHLIAAQLVFAYAFDVLLSWSRRDEYTLGFSQFPVIFSISLFLWFKPDWFFLQFALVATGFLAKELIRWEKNGRRVHIFNPSSFPLGLFSLVLLLTASTDKSWGQEIATTLNNAPYIYLFIFLIGLPGQLLFGVTSMTMSAVVTMYLFGLGYFALTGVYYFVDSYIPIAVFLGMHLLFTDPSTSPRSELGRVIFGVLYALSVVALYGVLSRLGMPTFYDKLMAVPLMNLAIRAIDRFAQSEPMRRLDPARLGQWLVGRRRNLAYVAVWTTVFLAMSRVGAVGDTHPGQWVPFWTEACEHDRPNGCRQLGVLVSSYCRAGSGWACNEYGILIQPAIRPETAARAFQSACDQGFSAGCDNLEPALAEHPRRAPPTDADYRILLRGRKGALPELTPRALHERACGQGYADGCRQACTEGAVTACSGAESAPSSGGGPSGGRQESSRAEH